MFFRQLKYRGDNFSYIIADEVTGDAMVVDPSFNADALLQTIRQQGFTLQYVVNTHHHRDHSTGNGALHAQTGAKVVAHHLAQVGQEVEVDDGDTLQVGGLHVEVLHTPGHSPDSICLLVEGKLLTGDTLFVGECGRTDLPGGSATALYHSLFQKILTLDESVEVYPGHDYGPQPASTIGVEKRTNYTLKPRTLREFIEFMREP